MKRWVGVLALLSVGTAGCGTICNLADGVRHPDRAPTVYGGLVKDVEWIGAGFQSVPFLEPPSFDDLVEDVGSFLMFALIDPPLSFIGDTVTLPLTLYCQRKRVAAAKYPAPVEPVTSAPDT